jgi:hypothetical protein
MPLVLPTRRRRRRRLALIVAGLAAYMGIVAMIRGRQGPPLAAAAHPEPVRLVNGWFYRGGERLLIKAVGWDPARPGEKPWARHRSVALVEEDFRRIRAAGFNTVRSWAPLTPVELAAAARQDLLVLQGIWVDRTGDFGDPAFRRRELEKVAQAVRDSRDSAMVLAYLVMNEPSPKQVLAQGVETTRALLREIRSTVRTVHPGAAVSFSSWPGLELLDEPSLDFVAVNLYPFRPKALLDAVGYAGMVRIWKELAGTRPLLVSEFGISVAPVVPEPDGPGGASEAAQAAGLPRLASDAVRGGATGLAAFMWLDGWWKNAESPSDERTHDSDDPEEWFGLHAFESFADDFGRPRPALAALRAWNRAALTSPAEGAPAEPVGQLEIFTEEPHGIEVLATADGRPVELGAPQRDGRWLRIPYRLPSDARRLEVRFVDGKGLFGGATRILRGRRNVRLDVGVRGVGQFRELVAMVRDEAGQPVAGVDVRIAVTEPTRRFDATHRARTRADGTAIVPVRLPDGPAPGFVAAAVRDGESEPPLALWHRVLYARGGP